MTRSGSGILSPRQGLEVLGDLAERTPFVAGQRVQSRRRPSAARRSSSRARWLAPGVAFAVLIGGVLALLNWFLASPRFAVRQVEIRGLTWLREAEVRAVAGIAPGQNLFTLDEEAIARRLQAPPRVQPTARFRMPSGSRTR